MDLGDSFPGEVLKLILSYIDCRRSQCNAALTCRRWYQLLTETSTHMDDTNEKVETFQRRIFERLESDPDRRLNLRAIQLEDVQILEKFTNYVGSCESIILHAADREFLDLTLSKLQNMNSRSKNLVFHLYDGLAMEMDMVERYFPDVKSLILRSIDPNPQQPATVGAISLNLTKLNRLRLHRLQMAAGFTLPPSVKCLEYTPIYSHSLDALFLSKLSEFNQLTSLTLGYFTFDTGSFRRFLGIIRHLSLLSTIKFESINFFGIDFGTVPTGKYGQRSTCGLKNLEFESCSNLPFSSAIMMFINALEISLTKVSISAESYYPIMDVLYVIPLLQHLNCDLELAIIDSTSSIRIFGEFPSETAILCKLEMEKICPPEFITDIFSRGNFEKLTQLSFHRCLSLNTTHIALISQFCVQLKCLTIIRCDNFLGAGLFDFLQNWNLRESRILEIFWEDYSILDEDETTPVGKLYLDLEGKPELLEMKKMRQFWKRNGNSRIIIWECNGQVVEEKPKILIIRDYMPGATMIDRFSII